MAYVEYVKCYRVKTVQGYQSAYNYIDSTPMYLYIRNVVSIEKKRPEAFEADPIEDCFLITTGSDKFFVQCKGLSTWFDWTER